jgi:2-haloacid dehalogenase
VSTPQAQKLDFSRFTTISFDCYGTLIDWEAGLLPRLRELLSIHGKSMPDSNILALYGEFEADAEKGEYQSYRAVLQSVVQKFGDHCGFRASPGELRSVYESIPSWKPFPDTVSALQELCQRYRLAVISNIDTDLFEETRKHLGVEFEAVITAQQAHSYKPALKNFQLAMQALGVEAGALLHAGQSIYHDVIPAQSLGISSVWVNRRSARPGVGAVRSAVGRPDLEVTDLATLVSLAME